MHQSFTRYSLPMLITLGAISVSAAESSSAISGSGHQLNLFAYLIWSSIEMFTDFTSMIVNWPHIKTYFSCWFTESISADIILWPCGRRMIRTFFVFNILIFEGCSFLNKNGNPKFRDLMICGFSQSWAFLSMKNSLLILAQCTPCSCLPWWLYVYH